jgi:hypothetical protein
MFEWAASEERRFAACRWAMADFQFVSRNRLGKEAEEVLRRAAVFSSFFYF